MFHFVLLFSPLSPPCSPTTLTYFCIIFQGTHGKEVGKGWHWDYDEEGGRPAVDIHTLIGFSLNTYI